jgi:putative membrane protein
MGYLIVTWVFSALGLFALAATLPGFRVLDYQSALLAAGVVGLISALAASAFKRITGTSALAVTGILLVLLDTFLFRLSALVVPGFAMTGFFPAVAGAAVLLAISLATARLLRNRDAELPPQTFPTG